MSAPGRSPGGRGLRWVFGLAVASAFFSGFGQMPIFKRYYLSDIPGLGWSQDFFILSDMHYIAVSVILALLAWRIALGMGAKGIEWVWGPRSWWPWGLLALLAVSGTVKMLRNWGVWLEPNLITGVSFMHVGAAAALLLTLVVGFLGAGRKKKAPA